MSSSMWDTEADKYWKEKKKEKIWQEKAFKIKSFLFVVAAVFLFLKLVSLSGGQSQSKNMTKSEPVASPESLQQCKDLCVAKVVDQCNSICRQYQSTAPRPLVFRSCQAPCVSVGHAICGVSTDEKRFVRNKCKISGQSMCQKSCKEYERVLPKPLNYQVCHEGCKQITPFSCETGSRCVARSLI